jgi:hypothetical protein
VSFGEEYFGEASCVFRSSKVHITLTLRYSLDRLDSSVFAFPFGFDIQARRRTFVPRLVVVVPALTATYRKRSLFSFYS